MHIPNTWRSGKQKAGNIQCRVTIIHKHSITIPIHITHIQDYYNIKHFIWILCPCHKNPLCIKGNAKISFFYRHEGHLERKKIFEKENSYVTNAKDFNKYSYSVKEDGWGGTGVT